MSMQQTPVPQCGLKRKLKSVGDNEQVNLAPQLRQHQNPHHAQTPSQTSQASLDHSMPDVDPSLSSAEDPLRPPRNTRGSCWASSLGRWMPGGNSVNSVRPPDPLDFSDSIPIGLPEIPAFLFHPRPHPILPQHILALPFNNILRRYNRLTRLVDDYQRWHTRSVFGFWTQEDLALAASGEAPEFTEAFDLDRPSIPPYVLNTRFDILLLGTPLLSHLIDRYHNDLGYDYFAFYHTDPRDNLSRSDFNQEGDPDDYSPDSHGYSNATFSLHGMCEMKGESITACDTRDCS